MFSCSIFSQPFAIMFQQITHPHFDITCNPIVILTCCIWNVCEKQFYNWIRRQNHVATHFCSDLRSRGIMVIQIWNFEIELTTKFNWLHRWNTCKLEPIIGCHTNFMFVHTVPHCIPVDHNNYSKTLFQTWNFQLDWFCSITKIHIFKPLLNVRISKFCYQIICVDQWHIWIQDLDFNNKISIVITAVFPKGWTRVLPGAHCIACLQRISFQRQFWIYRSKSSIK